MVSYGTEAGQFQREGYSVVICGPGSIEQAHTDDEWVDIGEIRSCADVLERFARRLV